MTNILIPVVLFVILLGIINYLSKKIHFASFYVKTILAYSIIILFIAAIIADPKAGFNAALNGTTLCLNVVFPSLFPFFVATYLLTNLGFVNILGSLLDPIMRPIFNVPGSGSFSFAMGMISGYPVGAKVIVEMHGKNLCTKTEAERLLTFCNNSGPLFILGSVAIGMFNNRAAGYLLLISHLLAAVTVGILFRFYKKERQLLRNQGKKLKAVSLKKAISGIRDLRIKDGRSMGEIFGDAIKNSINLLLSIAGFIIFFSVIINLLTRYGIIGFMAAALGLITRPLGISTDILIGVSSGFFEITTGIKIISSVIDVPFTHQLIFTSLVLGWAGLSVHSQVMSLMARSHISIYPYICGKLIHGVISSFYTFLLLQWHPISTAVSNIPSNPLIKTSHTDFITNLFMSLMSLGCCILLFCFAIIAATIKNACKNKKSS